MDFPLTFHLGPVALNAHLVFELLAFFIGFRYFLFLRKKQPDPIPTENRIWIFIGAAAGAFLGSRLLGALENPDWFFSGEQGWLYYYQSKTIIGGLLGGLFGVEVMKKYIGERQSSGDLFVFPLILAMMIGRIGCLSMGVYEPTFGYPTDLPWAMDLGDDIPRHPTALYEIAFLALLWLGIFLLEKKVKLVNGGRFKIFMVAYLLYRFAVGFIQPGWRFGFLEMTTLQAACLLGLVYYRQVFIHPRHLLQNKTANL